jgi:hypothetical protein
MASPAAILDVVLDANTTRARSELRRFDSALRRTDASTASATVRTSTLGRATNTVGTRLRSAAGYAASAAAAYLSISQAKAAITTTQDLAKTTAGLNRNLGLSVKEGSRWAAVAKSRDIDAKSLTMSFTILSRRVVDAAHAIREGGGAAETAMVPFTRLGLSQDDVVKGSKDLASFLPRLADAFGEAEGGAKRQASAQQLLGRGYATIIPLFADGAKGLREQQHWADEYGATLNEKTLKAQMKLVQLQRESKVAWVGLQGVFARAVTPALKTVNEEFQKIARIMASDELTNAEKFRRVGEIFAKWGQAAFDAFIGIFPKLVEEIGERAPAVAAAFVKGFFNAPILGQLLLGGWLLSKMGGLTAVGKLGSTIGTRLGRGIVAGIGGVGIASVLINELEGEGAEGIRNVMANKFLAVAQAWDISLEKAKRLVAFMEKHPGMEVPEALSQMQQARKNKLEPFITAIGNLREETHHSMRSIANDTERNMERIKNAFGTESQRAKRLLIDNYDAMIAAIQGAMRRGEIATDKGHRKIQQILRKQLKLYGVKATEFFGKAGIDRPGGTNTYGGVSTNQRGGAILEGRASGDSVPAMLERGEYVLNRKAVAAIGQRALDAVNFKGAPRFAAGGIVALGRQLQREGYEVGEHPAFGGVAPVHTTGSYHYRGQALDVNDDLPPFASGSGEPGSLDRLYARLKRMRGVVELLWRVANHYDHLHVAMGAGSGALPGMGGRVDINLPRFADKGFALSGVVTGSLNRLSEAVERKAERLVQPGAATGGVGMGSIEGAFNKAQLAQLWNRTGRAGDANLMAAIALAESGGDPRAHGPPDGRGLWQIEWPVWSQTLGHLGDPYNATANARMAHEVLRQQGLGAWVVYNTGAYRQFMQRGGFVGMQGGGGVGGHAGGMLEAIAGMGAGGGDPNLPKLGPLLNDIFKSDKGADRRKLLGRFADQLGRFGLNSRQVGDLEKLTTQAETYGEYADRASSLGPGEKVQGYTEAAWLYSQLETLRKLRNALIDAQATVERHRKKMQKLLDDARKHLAKVRRQLQRDGQDKQRVEDRISAEEKNQRKLKDALAAELDKPKQKRDKEKIARLRKQIEQSPKRIDELEQDLRRIDKRARQHGYVQSALRETILPGITEKVGGLGDSHAELMDQLGSVHGLGSPLTKYDKLPALGVLGGQIFDVQMRLRDMAAETTGRDPLTIAELLEFAEAAGLGAVQRVPAYASGGVHGGGLALVGERGPELATLPAGTRVHSNAESQGMLGGDMYVDVYVGGEKIAEHVRAEIRTNEKRSLDRWRAGVLR